jgi:hypothetical protein
MFGMPYVADVYYPSDLYDDYKDIRLNCGGTVVSVGVERYRNNDHTDSSGTKNAKQVMFAFDRVSKGQARRACGTNQAWVDVFTGKGAPRTIGTALEQVYRYRLEFIDAHRNQKAVDPDAYECAQMLKTYADQPAAMMKEACWRYVGLDCNGFVGNFVRVVKPRVGNANTKPKWFYDVRMGVRRTADDVDSMDLLIWADYSHIAIVDTYRQVEVDDRGRKSQQWRFNVVQCTGPGLIMEEKALTPIGGGLFRIDPPTKKGVAGPVHAVTLNLW